MDFEKLQEEIEDLLYVSLEIEDLSDYIFENSDLSREEAEELADELYGYVMDCEDSIRQELTEELVELVKEKVAKKYPEDAPGQLHLFEFKE